MVGALDVTLAIVIAAVVVVLTLFIRKRFLGKTLDKKFLTLSLVTALIRYKPTGRFEKVVEDILNIYLKENRTVLLVSSAPRTEIYAEMFHTYFQNGNLMLVKVSARARTDRFYLSNKTAKKEELTGKIAEISVDWLEYLSEIVESLPEKSIVVFEPLSDIVLMNGFDKSFKFIKKTLDFCVEAEIKMIAFLNDEAHEEHVRASFEGLFTNIANVIDHRLEMVK